MKVAILGAGMIGRIHLRAARLAGATVVGVLASSPERSQTVAQEHNLPGHYDSLEALCADPEVEAVHICTPNAQHFEQARQALEAGKHVICEKPLAISETQARTLYRLAQRQKRIATVPFVYRYHPMVREARERVRSGKLGPLHLIQGGYLQDWLLLPSDSNWRVFEDEGGSSRVFADIGSHWCDLVEWVSGEQFVSIMAERATTVPKRAPSGRETFSSEAHKATTLELKNVKTEDVAVALFKTDADTLASATFSQVSAGRKNKLWFELNGETSTLAFDQEEPDKLWLGRRHSNKIFVKDPTQGSAEQRRLATLPAGHAQSYTDCFEAFIRDSYAAMRGHTPEGLPTFEDGLRSAQLVDSFLKATQKPTWMSI